MNLDKFWQGIDRFTAESLSKNIANEIVYPAVKCVVSTILFFVILKLCKILATRLLFAFKGINRIPIIGGLNKVRGCGFCYIIKRGQFSLVKHFNCKEYAYSKIFFRS